MSIWKALETRMDKLVDRQFAEPVELHPWRKGSYSSGGEADDTRAVIKTQGIYVMPGAAISGEGGTQGAGLNTRVVTQDVWLSIIEDYTGNLADWKMHDRVYFPERGEWFEIAYTDPSATNRPNIHLLRLQS